MQPNCVAEQQSLATLHTFMARILESYSVTSHESKSQAKKKQDSGRNGLQKRDNLKRKRKNDGKKNLLHLW